MIEIVLSTLVFVAVIMVLSGTVLIAHRHLLPSAGIPITVNKSRELTGAAGGTLLDAMLEAQIPIPAACGGKGSCGLCKVQVTHGGGPVLPTEAGRLSSADLRAGKRLACQVRLRKPLAIEIEHALLHVQNQPVEVLSSRSLTPTIKEIVFQLPEGRDFGFTPGDFVLVTAPPFRMPLEEIDLAPFARQSWAAADLIAEARTPVTRAYSIANRPEDAGCIVLNIRLALPPPDRLDLPPGAVSSWLFGLKPGDPVTHSGPFGDFHASDSRADMVIVGGGVGMAPLRAIVHDQLAQGSGRQITYFFGARSQAEMYYADEFEILAKVHSHFTWVPVLSEETEPGWSGETGFVHETLIRRHLDTHPEPEACEYYLCGPPLMIRAVIKALREAGVHRSHIFFDDFGS